MRTTRRQFLTMAGAAAAAAAIPGKRAAANDRVRMAAVGINGRGWRLAEAAHQTGMADLVALCDADAQVLEKRARDARALTGSEPAQFQDIRDLLESGAIDAVAIATPNHWHVLAAIWAMEAGKDVYLEKPISHTIFEGRQLINAATKYGRVLQHGTQRRSDPSWQRAMERARSGEIGDLYMARTTIMRKRSPFWYPPEDSPPAHLDWTLWQGPAPEQPFSQNYVHYNWHWFWHYGNGEIGNNNPHAADLVNWALDKGLPVSTSSTGGIFGYDKDARETPNTQVVQHTFADGTVYTIDIRNRHTAKRPFVSLFGAEGYLENTTLYNPGGEVIPVEEPLRAIADSTIEHMRNFLKAVQSGDPQAVNATAEQGHVAAGLCHLGNIAYRTGRKLTFDPKTETFPGDGEANALLTREYRDGFAVPEIA